VRKTDGRKFDCSMCIQNLTTDRFEMCTSFLAHACLIWDTKYPEIVSNGSQIKEEYIFRFANNMHFVLQINWLCASSIGSKLTASLYDVSITRQ
jgi:hypothetical protein